MKTMIVLIIFSLNVMANIVVDGVKYTVGEVTHIGKQCLEVNGGELKTPENGFFNRNFIASNVALFEYIEHEFQKMIMISYYDVNEGTVAEIRKKWVDNKLTNIEYEKMTKVYYHIQKLQLSEQDKKQLFIVEEGSTDMLTKKQWILNFNREIIDLKEISVNDLKNRREDIKTKYLEGDYLITTNIESHNEISYNTAQDICVYSKGKIKNCLKSKTSTIKKRPVPRFKWEKNPLYKEDSK